MSHYFFTNTRVICSLLQSLTLPSKTVKGIISCSLLGMANFLIRFDMTFTQLEYSFLDLAPFGDEFQQFVVHFLFMSIAQEVNTIWERH